MKTNSSKSKPCHNCQQPRLFHKLGRCRACMFQSLVLSLCCWGGYFWLLNTENTKAVSIIAILFFAISFSLLLLAHLLMALYLKITIATHSA